MSLAVPAEPTLEASLASTLDVLAWEMELASARCIFLDAAIGQMMDAIPEERRAEFVESMHTVDLLCQQLTSLSAFTRNMSGAVAEDVSAPVQAALGEITLGALADRMSTALGGENRGVEDRDGAGDFDLF
jgi:hypothetical protein